MGFKCAVVSPTMGWIGYNVMETPREIMAAVAEAGYDGIDVPGEPKQMDGKEWRKMAEEAGRTGSTRSPGRLGFPSRRRGTLPEQP